MANEPPIGEPRPVALTKPAISNFSTAVMFSCEGEVIGGKNVCWSKFFGCFQRSQVYLHEQ